MKKRIPQAFTLVELLAVMAVAGIVFTLSLTALNSMKRSSGLTNGMNDLVGELARGRQLAITKNRAVEVRFYRDESGAAAGQHYRSFQLFEYADDGATVAAGKVKWLPGGVILDSNANLSTLLADSQIKSWNHATDPQPSLPGPGLNYSAKVFRFRPDGSADLPMSGSQWFVTLHSAVDGDNRSTLPPNYATVQVEPVNGLVRYFRP